MYDLINHVTVISLILFTSIFVYIVIHQTSVPIVKNTEILHIQYDSTCEENCSTPYATVQRLVHLSRGQSYKFVIELDMPESEVNRNQGMFMLHMSLMQSGKVVHISSRPAALRYKSRLVRILSGLFYAPLYATNYKEEVQTINVQMIDNYIEGASFSYANLDLVRIDILVRNVQIYSAKLHIIANLVGLKYLMYHWQLTSAIIGITTVAFFITLLSFYKGELTDQHRLYINDNDYETER